MVVNVSSLWAIQPTAGVGLYCSTRALRDMHMKCVAHEVRGVGVVCVCEGRCEAVPNAIEPVQPPPTPWPPET
jgi:NAD(P)-dependent dehydrogenase (short-subunit alcohol dehydrogenase family)